MPRKTKTARVAETALPSIPKELIDQFVIGPMSAEAVNAASMAFKKALIERALGAELSHHLGYAPGAAKPDEASNQRNGRSGKTVLTDDGPLRIEVPRDRDGSFEPVLIPKHERRFTGFDDKIVAMYARGMTVREVQGFLAEQYGVEVSPEFISSVTDAVMAEVTAWQSRPLEPMYPVVFFDALRVKIREDAVVRNKAIYLALAILPDGTRDILGLWIENTEGAKFWLKVFNDLRTRGVADILIAVTDGLKGIGEALGAAFPSTTLQTCIVHLIRNSLELASWKERKLLTNVADLAPKEVVASYKALADIERGFKILKSEIEIAPVFHRLPDRIRAHAMLCFMALILYRVMRGRLKLAGVEVSPERALEQLRAIQRHRVRINDAAPIDGISSIDAGQADLFQALKLQKPTRDTQMTLL
ncbi:MAG: IS256 family transposase [Burkholderiales bacterium]|nr:IS256 family transposase [Burkholderiales bacterium]